MTRGQIIHERAVRKMSLGSNVNIRIINIQLIESRERDGVACFCPLGRERKSGGAAYQISIFGPQRAIKKQKTCRAYFTVCKQNSFWNWGAKNWRIIMCAAPARCVVVSLRWQKQLSLLLADALHMEAMRCWWPVFTERTRNNLNCAVGKRRRSVTRDAFILSIYFDVKNLYHCKLSSRQFLNESCWNILGGFAQKYNKHMQFQFFGIFSNLNI